MFNVNKGKNQIKPLTLLNVVNNFNNAVVNNFNAVAVAVVRDFNGIFVVHVFNDINTRHCVEFHGCSTPHGVAGDLAG